MNASVAFGERTVGTGNPVLVVAEVGVNHDGDLATALELVDAAAEAGADAVKFQTFDVAQLVTSTADLAAYQRERAGKVESQREMLAALELGGYDRDRVHGHVLTREAVDAQLRRLAALPLEERRRLPGLEPARAPVIVAGVAIVAEALRFFDLAELEVSEHDLLTGAALAAAELPEREEGDAPPGAYTCC